MNIGTIGRRIAEIRTELGLALVLFAVTLALYWPATKYGYVDFDSEYPAAIKALKDAGIDQYVAEINRQLEEFMAKK